MIKAFALLLLRFYKLAISPYMGDCCRYVPSCSEYARIVIEKHGVAKGCVMAAKRLVQCGPWGRWKG